MLSVAIAFLAGVLTVLAPCTLPLLPVLLGASVGRSSRARPLFIALGFVVSFATVVLVIGSVTQAIGIDPDVLRTGAIVLLALFGLLMLYPRPFDALMARLGPLVRPNNGTPIDHSGNLGGFVLGTTLGLVWTPCAGPVLGSILTVIATSPAPGASAFLLFAYALGAAIPMLAIAYGGQFATTRVRRIAAVAPRLRQGFGLMVIGFAVAMHFQYDTLITAWIADFYPNGQIGL